MSVEARERDRRQRVLRQLNAQLLAASPKAGLGVQGSQVHLQPKGVLPKPSRIPRPDSPASRPLPPFGYAAETILSVPTSPRSHPITSHVTPHPQSPNSHPVNPWQEEEPPATRTTQATPPVGHQHRHGDLVVMVKKESQVFPDQYTGQSSPLRAGGGLERGEGVRRREDRETGNLVGTESQVHWKQIVRRDQPAPEGKTGKKGSLKKFRNTSGSLARAGDRRKRGVGSPAAREGGKGRAGRVRREEGGEQECERRKEGRHNELRIRCVARKYFMLWAHRVYGRVLPSAARAHHRVVVRRRVFLVWREVWWVARREWKLNIRAECHNRYRLWQLVWQAWTECVELSREKQRRNEAARAFSSLKMKRSAWRGWCEYVRRRREKGTVRREAERRAGGLRMRSAWVRWVAALREKRKSRVMDTAALHLWALQLQRKSWNSWMSQYQLRWAQSLQVSMATHHHAHTLLSQCWQVWLVYRDTRRRKARMRATAVGYHTSRSLLRSFHTWRVRHRRAVDVAQFTGLLEEKGRAARLRRGLTQWKFYMSLCRHQSYQMELAGLQHSLTVKSKVFHAVKKHADDQKRQVIDKAVACQFYTRKRLQLSWCQWLKRCEHCEEIKVLPQTRRARRHHGLLILGKAMRSWRTYILWRRERRRQVVMAEEHFKARALPRCLAAMIEFVDVQHYKQCLRERAQEFRRETLLSMVFYRWWRASHLSQEVRMLERVAILHREEVVRRGTLWLWRARTRERMRELEQERKAVVHYRHTLMSGALTKWTDRREDAVQRARQWGRAAEQHSHQLLRVAWTAWGRYMARRRLSNQSRGLAVEHFNTVLVAGIFQAWKVYHVRAHQKHAKTLRAVQFYHSTLTRRSLTQWCQNVQGMRSQYRMEEDACLHCRTSSLRKYLTSWRERTALSVEMAQVEGERVREAVQHLDRAKLSRLFAAWREYTSSCVVDRLGKERADRHRARVLLRRCLAVWHDHHRLGIRKMLLRRQCSWFHNTRLLSTHYSKWRLEFMHAVMMRQKSTLSLWHWSQTLQRKALAAWLLYTLNRRRKAERYAQAMERYRKRLITIGVTQWIKVATASRALRMENALSQQAKSVRSVMLCVRRCALHWRKVTRDRRKGRQRPPAGHLQVLTVPPRLTSVALTGGMEREEVGRGGRGTIGDRSLTGKPDNIWNSLASKLQLPDGASHTRPLPRRPEFLRPANTTAALGGGQPCPRLHHHLHIPPGAGHMPGEAGVAVGVSASEVHPRVTLPHPSSPPVHLGYQAIGSRDATFVFQPSTCSEDSFQRTEYVAPSRHTGQDSSGVLHFPPNSSSDMNLPPNASSLPQTEEVANDHVQARQAPEPSTTSGRVLLPPAAFQKQRTNQDWNPRELESRLRAAPQANHLLPPECGSTSSLSMLSPTAPVSVTPSCSTTSMAVDLSAPSIKSEIVRIRDELQKFHDLKSQQKALQEQLSQAEEEGEHSHVTELQQELSVITRSVQEREPTIRRLASRISQLLTQLHGNTQV